MEAEREKSCSLCECRVAGVSEEVTRKRDLKPENMVVSDMICFTVVLEGEEEGNHMTPCMGINIHMMS